ncbi:MAG: hypothetical protein KF718_09890 [Polyangiaceae bacterium]|nr:hypothetical protein [Polyangiaceae bacterium]
MARAAHRPRGQSLWAAALFAVACGGSDDGQLYGGAGGGAPADSGTGGVGAAAGSAGSSGASGGAAGQAGGGAGGASGASGAGGEAGHSGGSGGGSGGATGVGTGPCGGELCGFSLGATCCASSSKGLYCANAGLGNPCTCSGLGCDKLEITCDGPEDCPTGQRCCATKEWTGPKYDEVKCRTACSVTARDVREVCHAGGQPCANGKACSADANLPPNYATCAP